MPNTKLSDRSKLLSKLDAMLIYRDDLAVRIAEADKKLQEARTTLHIAIVAEVAANLPAAKRAHLDALKEVTKLGAEAWTIREQLQAWIRNRVSEGSLSSADLALMISNSNYNFNRSLAKLDGTIKGA